MYIKILFVILEKLMLDLANGVASS